ncbi:MAG: ABC transporter substrate-binding protein [Chloroflexi bacterium]|nr:ABC transporter substrate-binding protein [Chloroflexota bacterium]MCI0576365.1 ABC transporter substrate-binding protein [Chloroflexota bacterium]MCI0646198.1 ABC transporter substrate-binding protein [Chloroflexota bacterium]
MIGTTIQDRYRLEAELGRGGMGIVYRAYDTVLGRPVAVKVLSAAGLGTEGQSRLLNEAQTAARLNHPNIVAIYDAGRAGDAPFIVMELVEGRSLRHFSGLSLNDVLVYIRQVCLALEQAHAHGIIHRDLKPENILVTASQTVKLMDFGLARTSDGARLTTEGTLLGTFNYMAPEVLMGEAASLQSDLYALGVMFYELAAGRSPFEGENLVAILSQHIHAPVVPPSTFNSAIPATLDGLIVRLLGKRPEERPGSAAEVRQALERLATGEWPTGSLPVMQQGVLLLDRLALGRLVGREREFTEAQALWRQATAGEGRALLISGEPGIGKTRLTQEIVTLAELSRGVVLLGECYAEGGAPYTPIAQIIRAGLAHLPSGNGRPLPDNFLADLATLAPELRSHYPELPPNPALDPQAEQQRLFDSVVALCTALATQGPLLLILDDAHWADSGTLFLLRHLARRSRHLRLFMVLTYREVELDDTSPFHQVLLDFNRERLAARLKLPRLTREQTRELLAAMFAEEITSEFLDGIYHETEGNPFFIEEVCKALVESEQLYREGGRWQRPAMEEMEIPQSVRLAIQTRVGKLPAGGQETLRLAAVIGREFDFATLKAISELDEETLIDALERAERAQLVQQVHQGRAADPKFAFAHALIPATLRESLSGLRRQRLHRRVALVLEQLYPNRPDELAPRLGRHFAEAGEVGKAVTYLLRAGDGARKLYAYQEAIDHYQQVVWLEKEEGHLEQAARTLMKLGQVYHMAMDFSRSRQAYEEGFLLWQRAGAPQAAVTARPAHTLRIGWAQPITIDPTLSNDLFSGTVIDQLFEGLLELTPEMDLVPAIARAWEVLESGQKYVFHLREDARWSDGVPVTAADFSFAWKRALDPETRSLAASYLQDIKGARAFLRGEVAASDNLGIYAPDDHTLVVELEGPTGYFLHLLAFSSTYPIPRHVVEVHGPAWTETGRIVSNGPFLLESWQPGQSLVMQRNPDYRGRAAGNIQRIEMVPTGPQGVDPAVYESDQVDVLSISTLPPAGLELARQQFAGEFLQLPGVATLFAGLDPGQPPFDDGRVRRAFAQAIDKERLANITARSTLSPAAGGFVPPGIPGHSPNLALPYDPEQARQLLAEAGYPGGQGFPSLTLLTSNNFEFVGQYLQEQWRQTLGISLGREVMEWPTFLRRLRSERAPFYWMVWLADYPDPDNFLRVGLAPLYNRRWNPTYCDLVDEARQLMDRSERMKLYQAADRILIEEAAVLPLAYGQWHLLIKPWVKKYRASSFKWWYWKDIVMA